MLESFTEHAGDTPEAPNCTEPFLNAEHRETSAQQGTAAPDGQRLTSLKGRCSWWEVEY